MKIISSFASNLFLSFFICASTLIFGQEFGQYKQKIRATDGVGNPAQGYSSAISDDGNLAVSGGYLDNGGMGAAWVFTFNGIDWLQTGTKLVGADAIGASNQGYAVDISADGKIIAVSGIADNDSIGAVWTYVYTGSDWIPLGTKITPPNTLTGTNGKLNFGYSVSLSQNGQMLAVGSPLANNGNGIALVYSFDGSNWINQQVNIVPNDAVGAAYFGNALKMSADGQKLISCGLDDNNGNGAGWVFTFNGIDWLQVGDKLIPSDAILPTATGLNFGTSVSASSSLEYVIIGSNNDANGMGGAWIFSFSGINQKWQQQGMKLVALDTLGLANQGISVAMSSNGSIAAVGGFSDDNYNGALWSYINTGSEWQRFGRKLQSSDPGDFPFLSKSCDLNADGSRLVAGAFFEDFNIGSIRIFNNATYTLTVTSFSQIRNCLEANPIFTYTIVGFDGGDTPANLLSIPTVTTQAVITSAGGNYPLRTEGGASLKYNFIYIDSLLIVNKLTQTISGFSAIPNQTFGGAAFTVDGISTAALPLSFIYTGEINMVGNTVSILGTGLVTITAVQIGNGYFEQAEPVIQSFEIIKSNQILVDFGPTIQQRFNTNYVLLNHTVTSGLPIDYSTIGVATVSGDTLRFTNVGFVTITGIQNGNANYFPSNSISKELEIVKGLQVISSVYASDTVSFEIGQLTLTGFSDANLPIDYTVLGANLISQTVVSITNAGMITILGVQIGNSLYEPTSVTSAFIYVKKATQTISGVVIPQKINTNQVVTLSGISSSGMPVTFQTANSHVTITGNQLISDIAQVITISTFQIGSQNYFSSDTIIRIIDCKNAQSVVGFSFIPNQSYDKFSYSLATITTSSTLPISIVVSGAGVLIQDVLSFAGLGLVTVTAFQIGNSQYFATDTIVRIFNITQGNQTILGLSAIPTQIFGNPPITLSGFSTSGLPISYSVAGAGSLLGNILNITSLGIITITAYQLGNGLYSSAFPVITSFSVSAATQTINGLTLPSAIPYGSVVTLTGSATSNLPIVYVYSGNVLSNGNIFTVTGLGNITIVASQSGNANVLPATNITLTSFAIKANQTIAGIGNLPDKKPNDPPFSLPLYASSGLLITYSISGPVLSNGASITITGPGLVSVQASQSGNVNYNPATNISSSFIVKFTQTITGFNSISQKTFGDGLFLLNAIASSGFPVSYSVAGPAFIVGSNAVSITGAGNVTITAYQLGDAYYLPANSQKQVFNVQKANQTILGISFFPDSILGNNLWTITSTITSNLPIQLFASGTSVIVNNQLFVNENRNITITGFQAGNANFNSTYFETILPIQKLDQRITNWSDTPIQAFNNQILSFDAVASSGLNVSYGVSGAGVLVGNAVSILGTGILTITAYQLGDNTYHPSPSQTKLIEVIKGQQNLSFSLSENVTIFGITTLTLSGFLDSGLLPSYIIQSSPSSIAGIKNNNMLEITNSGTITITAFHLGNNNYEASNEVMQVINISKTTNIETSEQIEIFEIQVYPNPNEGVFTIQSDSRFVDKKYKIVDVLGNKIRGDLMPTGKIKIENLSPGIYFIQIEDELKSKKIIVY
ncbi:MAG: T9SS C-terminal target domain-containing protein [Cytophagales bacterium]|nr:MAG: T9SS C-terminal target domain-containing protein [Cytophagales bacterium]